MKIEYPRFGEIVIDGERFDHDVVLEAGRIRRRKKGPSKVYRDEFGHTPLSLDEEIPWSAPRLVIGTGADGRLPIMEEVREQAKARGMELLELPTAEACQALRSTRRKEVNAILHVTC
ncbi:MAG: MTH938/NDUFAF3 family protein [Acidimicrobiia bacterium]